MLDRHTSIEHYFEASLICSPHRRLVDYPKLKPDYTRVDCDRGFDDRQALIGATKDLNYIDRHWYIIQCCIRLRSKYRRAQAGMGRHPFEAQAFTLGSRH